MSRMATGATLAVTLCVTLGAALLLAATPLEAAGTAKVAARGRAVLQQNCARCHAIDSSGASPMTTAPPLRGIYARFAPRELQAELSEGMVSHFRNMPQIEFASEDVDAIMAYLYQLSARQWRAAHPRAKARGAK
jgi:mono/diheme cytochrome c family protein